MGSDEYHTLASNKKTCQKLILSCHCQENRIEGVSEVTMHAYNVNVPHPNPYLT